MNVLILTVSLNLLINIYLMFVSRSYFMAVSEFISGVMQIVVNTSFFGEPRLQ